MKILGRCLVYTWRSAGHSLNVLTAVFHDWYDVIWLINSCMLPYQFLHNQTYQHDKSVIPYVKQSPKAPAFSVASPKRTQWGSWQLWEWEISRLAERTHTHRFTHWPPLFITCNWNMALGRHRENPPFLSVLAFQGILRSSMAGAAPGVQPARSVAWRLQPPLNVAGWAPTEDKGALSNSVSDTPSPMR